MIISLKTNSLTNIARNWTELTKKIRPVFSSQIFSSFIFNLNHGKKGCNVMPGTRLDIWSRQIW